MKMTNQAPSAPNTIAGPSGTTPSRPHGPSGRFLDEFQTPRILTCLRTSTLMWIGFALLQSSGFGQAVSANAGKFSRIQGWATITREDFLPFQLEIHRNPYYVGVELAPRERVRIHVYEIAPDGTVADSERAIIQAPSKVIPGEPIWMRVKGMRAGARYAVSFSPLSSSSGVRIRRYFDWGGVRRLNPTGGATGHPSAAPASSPYTPSQSIQPSPLAGHRFERLRYPR